MNKGSDITWGRLERIAVMTGVLAVLVVAAGARPGHAQLAPIAFPDTAVGSSSTIKCPNTVVAICFGTNCSGTGTVQGVSGASAPFSVGKYNLLSNSEFFAGSCEAHPVNLPVTVGPGQVLAYQVVFTPTQPGTFNGTLTFSTLGGPSTANLTGKATAPAAGGNGRALISIETGGDTLVPGSILDLRYQTKPLTLQGRADVYFVVQFASGEVAFVDDAGGLVPGFAPFRRDVAVADETRPLATTPVPVDLPFGTYRFYMALGRAGMTPDPANLQPFLASNIAEAAVTYAPLSAEQQALLQSRGNPDFLSVLWVGQLDQKMESWLYLSSPATRYSFVNGALDVQEPEPDPGGGPGPKLDPSLFTAQTTLAQLTAALGPPSSTETLVEGFEAARFPAGLDVTFRDGRLSSATTRTP
jgi:hypothetical protein